MSANLYNDLHPKKSLKNTGFKNEQMAIKTMNLIKKRSLRYQFDIINTMYNRAKYHPHRTIDMEKAMIVYNKWLKNYKKNKEIENNKYPILELKNIVKYEKIADKYNIDKSFLNMYKKVNGKSYKLQYILLDENKPNGYDFISYRIKILQKLLNKNKSLFNKDGSLTKYHLYLIMHAYSPKYELYNNDE